jgi:predicted RNase H-like nuclease
MPRLAPVLFAAVLSLPIAAWSQGASVATAAAKAPGERIAAAEVEVRARVVELDLARRTAVLRGPRGQLVTVDVPPEVKNFDQVRVGDMLVIRYLTAVAARIEPASASGIRERVESQAAASASAGAQPAAGATRTVEVLAVVESLNRVARTLTLRGAKRTVRVNVPEGVDLTRIKQGDEVRAVFTEAVVLSVVPAPRAAAGASR